MDNSWKSKAKRVQRTLYMPMWIKLKQHIVNVEIIS